MSLYHGTTRAHCVSCDTPMPIQALCWRHDALWETDDPRPCRHCCPGCQAEGEAATWDVAGTVIWCPRTEDARHGA